MKRETTVAIRMSEVERERIEKAAAARHLAVATMIRQAALRVADEIEQQERDR